MATTNYLNQILDAAQGCNVGIRMNAKEINIVNKDDILELTIEDMGAEGEGIAKVDGYTLFIKDALEGDKVKIKVIKTKKSFGYGRLLEIIEPSPYRVQPKCEIARQCGGCQLQHCAYEKQLVYKEKKVKDCLVRIGKFNEEFINSVMEPMIGMDEPYYYRNKAQFPVGRNKEGEVVSGFYASRTHSIIDTTHCYIQAKVNEDILKIIKEFIHNYDISTYNELSHTGLVRHILTRVGFTTGEIMVCLIINGKTLPHQDKLIESLTQLSGMASISLNINQEKTNIIMGNKIIYLWGEQYITDYIGEVKYHISPLSFYQVNPAQTKKLYEIALEYANLTGNEVVWDLYCGIGTISLFLAQKAKQVYGVEIIPQAIQDAKINAEINGIRNAEFFVGAAEEVLPQKYKEENIYADVIVVDPPRKGCEPELLAAIAEMKPKRIVYVSCDPGTLARDLKWICGEGYEVKRVRVVDQFGQSCHIEVVIQMTYCGDKAKNKD